MSQVHEIRIKHIDDVKKDGDSTAAKGAGKRECHRCDISL